MSNQSDQRSAACLTINGLIGRIMHISGTSKHEDNGIGARPLLEIAKIGGVGASAASAARPALTGGNGLLMFRYLSWTPNHRVGDLRYVAFVGDYNGIEFDNRMSLRDHIRCDLRQLHYALEQRTALKSLKIHKWQRGDERRLSIVAG
jgi:hypothetical protein